MMATDPSKQVVSVPSREDDKEKAETQTKQEYKKIIKKLKRALLVDALSASEFKEFYELTQFLDKFPLPRVLLELVTDFLDSFALETSVKIIPPLLTAFGPDMEEKRQVKEILPHVFNAHPQGIESLFNGEEGAPHPKILLKKASYDEGYFSQKLNKFVCFRHWKSVSPLQAAYLCGDGPFLGRKFLCKIVTDIRTLPPNEAKLLLAKAQQQLQELLNRGVNAEKTSANNTAVMVSAAATANNNSTVDNKKMALCHRSSENTENEFADNSEFLAPIKELIKAYHAYILQFDSLVSQKKWAKLDKLWEQVGECQKKLSQYVKQEFLSPIPFTPLPEFNTEPSRVACSRYYWDDLLNLDKLGIGSNFGLYKGRTRWLRSLEATWECRAAWTGWLPWGKLAQGEDLAAISHLCELRETDLRNTIDSLQTPESALAFVANKTPRRVF